MQLPKNGVFLISNHSTYLDSWVLSAAQTSSCEFATAVWHGVPKPVQYLARPVIQVFDAGRNRQFLKQIRTQLKRRNVIVFPEGTFTDTLSGLLRFEKSVFALKRPVYMVAVRYHRPLPFLQPLSLSTHPIWQTAVEMFQPWTTVDRIPLGRLVPAADESAQDLANRAQRSIAGALGLEATHWTRHDRGKLLFAKHTPVTQRNVDP
ncbi:MAG: 1-acyl-sn-glycerol-3-phosphate acyltransferase [Planctomycetota bacterium]